MPLKKEYIDQLRKVLLEALRAEWVAQGHNMTGRAIDETQIVVSESLQGYAIDGYIPRYAGIVDKGVEAGNIPFSPGSGAGKSAYIQGLIAYARKRMNISDLAQAKSVAFAIAHTHKREGMPTKGSYQFTQTGKRTRWVEEALRKKEGVISELVRRAYRDLLEVEVSELLTKYKTRV